MTDQREIAGILRRGLSDSGFAAMIRDERALKPCIFRDGPLARVEFHVDRDEARRAAGLV